MPTARQGIDFLKSHLDAGLKHVDLPDADNASGFAVAFGPTDYVVVSVEHDSPEYCSVTGGLLKNVQSERRIILEYCNTETANNPGAPVYCPLGGTVVLTQWHSPIAIIARIPELFMIKVNETPEYVAEKRDSWLRDGILGEPFGWNDADVELLFRKATTATI